MRLIDADEFEKRIRVAARDRCSVAPWSEYGWVQQVVYFMPAADPVEHGRWMYNSHPSDFWECSECGGIELHPHDKYCRNCGAKMDGEQE